MEPFRIEVPDEALADLAQRLAGARLPARLLHDGTESAERLARVAALLDRWRDGFDWRAAEAALNAVPQARVRLDGTAVHVARVRGRGPAPLPLLLVNGWPSTFAEYLPALPLLADPAAHGGDAADAFDVVVATRPGYPFSDPAHDRPPDERRDGALLGRVMTEGLGHARFVAHGDDFGGTLVSGLGLDPPPGLLAIHVAEWLETPVPEPDDLTAAERAYLDALAAWTRAEGGYSHIQGTRPQTLALALDDSPLGLLAWIADKLLSWADPDGPGVPDELILTTTAIYWFTRSIGTSMRTYAGGLLALEPGEQVRAPAFVVAAREARPAPPPEWIGRTYADVRGYERLPRAGHFWAAEDPRGFAEHLRAAFRPFR